MTPSEDLPLLAADAMLGRLATWLRLLGLDVLFLEASAGRAEKRLRAAGRVFLTRDSDLTIGRTIRLTSDDPWSQLGEVLDRLGLDRQTLDRLPLLSRCPRCNARLEDLDPEEAALLVPDHVLAEGRVFRRCPDCRRVFWPGSHKEKILARLRSLDRPAMAEQN